MLRIRHGPACGQESQQEESKIYTCWMLIRPRERRLCMHAHVHACVCACMHFMFTCVKCYMHGFECGFAYIICLCMGLNCVFACV